MKRHLMRYFILMTAIIIIFGYRFVNVTYANTDVSSEHMSHQELNIQVMPEYVIPPGWTEEDPAVLHVYQGLFINEGEEPFEGSFSTAVPIDDPTFVLGFVGQYEGEDVVEQEFKINEEERIVEWSTVEPVQPGEQYRYIVEYYYAPLGKEKERAFDFNHLAKTEIDSLRVFLFEPIGATNIQLSEDPGNVVDMYGAPVHQYEFQNVKSGDTFELEVSYDKDSTITTMEALDQQMMPNDEVHQGMGQGNSSSGQLISNESAIMISVSIIIAGVFIFLGLRNRQKSPKNNPVVVDNNKKKEESPQDKDFAGEKKRLRQQLIDGQIDEETYRKKLSKLS